MDILNEIYYGNYSVPHPADLIPAPLIEKDILFWDKAEEALGKDVVQQAQDRLYEIDQAELLNSFREGFRLGVRLMLELL